MVLYFPRFPRRTLGERIRRFRLEQGIYQTQLAKRIGVGEMTIVNREKDRTIPWGQRLGNRCILCGDRRQAPRERWSRFA